MAPKQGRFTTTTPTINNATSTTVLAANPVRTKIKLQNLAAANIMISLDGATLTGIVPTSTNIGFVLTSAGFPHSSWESDPAFVPINSITAYQTSGSAINTLVVGEG